MSWSATILPLFSDQKYTYNISLDGTGRILYFYLNQRTNTYHFDVSNEDGTEIIQGIPLIPNCPIGVESYPIMQQFGFTGHFYMTPVNNNIVFTNIPPANLATYYVFFYLANTSSS